MTHSPWLWSHLSLSLLVAAVLAAAMTGWSNSTARKKRGGNLLPGTGAAHNRFLPLPFPFLGTRWIPLVALAIGVILSTMPLGEVNAAAYLLAYSGELSFASLFYLVIYLGSQIARVETSRSCKPLTGHSPGRGIGIDTSSIPSLARRQAAKRPFRSQLLGKKARARGATCKVAVRSAKQASVNAAVAEHEATIQASRFTSPQPSGELRQGRTFSTARPRHVAGEKGPVVRARLLLFRHRCPQEEAAKRVSERSRGFATAFPVEDRHWKGLRLTWAVSGLALYASALGGRGPDIYSLGFGPPLMWAGLALCVWLAFSGRWLAGVLLLGIIWAWQLQLSGGANFWDYAIDPFIFAGSVAGILWRHLPRRFSVGSGR